MRVTQHATGGGRELRCHNVHFEVSERTDERDLWELCAQFRSRLRIRGPLQDLWCDSGRRGRSRWAESHAIALRR